MAHQEPEAGDAFTSDMDNAAAEIDKLFGSAEDIDADDETDDNDDHSSDDQDDELDLSEDEDGDEESEPETPAIEVPNSLTAEEKAKFAALPKDAQQYVADLESRRAIQVQTATTKAAQAQRQAEVTAARADAEAKAILAEKVKGIADYYAPQPPDPQLARTHPADYIALDAEYKTAKAHHDALMEQVGYLETEAVQQMSEAEVKARDEELMEIAEVKNPDTREVFFKRAIETGQHLGLDMSQINHATAGELKALRQISDWKERAEKYDAAMMKQMQRVRESKKSGSAKPNAVTSNERGTFQKAKDRAKQSGDVRDAAAAIARLG